MGKNRRQVHVRFSRRAKFFPSVAALIYNPLRTEGYLRNIGSHRNPVREKMVMEIFRMVPVDPSHPDWLASWVFQKATERQLGRVLPTNP